MEAALADDDAGRHGIPVVTRHGRGDTDRNPATMNDVT
jgi:hypothetical protein